jgi:hypothetical protein
MMFYLQKIGHLSHNCPNKIKKNAPMSTQNLKITAHIIEPKQEKNPKKAMAEQIKAMSTKK